MIMIDKLGSGTGDTFEDVQEQEKLLKSLRQVNEDDILSRVLCADSMADGPATRASEDSSVVGSSSRVDMNEEVTLCSISHAETTMAECISDGIEAHDIGSLLEQFLEYEKAISPALSSTESAAPVDLPSEVENKQRKSNSKKVKSSAKTRKLKAATKTVQISPLDEPLAEIFDLDILVDNQVTISTTSEEDCVTSDRKDEAESGDSGAAQIDEEIKQDCFIVNKNGIVVVEYRNSNVENDDKQKFKAEVSSDLTEMENDSLCEKGDVKQDVNNFAKKEVEDHDIEMKCEEKESKGDVSLQKEETSCNGEQHQPINTKMQSIVGQHYKAPKVTKNSRSRERSRSPLTRHTTRSYERLKARDYSSSSDDEDEKQERYERYRSERRTPMRRDDRRKRRKYSSCSDDEYDYYRYSKRGSRGSFRGESPRRSHCEHDYNKPRTHQRDYYRSSSVRERSERDYSSSRRSQKKERYDDDYSVHERLSDLAMPVPYDIEHERKIGFLVKESGRGSYERRNVYAGGIQRNVTKRDLIRRFECFGPVEKVTLHFREKGDNYAFVIFEDAKDAIKAVKDGNSDPNYEPLDLCFGGRRKFVGGSYVDFDANTSYLEENELTLSKPASPVEDNEFDTLLEMAKREQSVN